MVSHVEIIFFFYFHFSCLIIEESIQIKYDLASTLHGELCLHFFLMVFMEQLDDYCLLLCPKQRKLFTYSQGVLSMSDCNIIAASFKPLPLVGIKATLVSSN